MSVRHARFQKCLPCDVSPFFFQITFARVQLEVSLLGTLLIGQDMTCTHCPVYWSAPDHVITHGTVPEYLHSLIGAREEKRGKRRETFSYQWESVRGPITISTERRIPPATLRVKTMGHGENSPSISAQPPTNTLMTSRAIVDQNAQRCHVHNPCAQRQETIPPRRKIHARNAPRTATIAPGVAWPFATS